METSSHTNTHADTTRGIQNIQTTTERFAQKQDTRLTRTRFTNTKHPSPHVERQTETDIAYSNPTTQKPPHTTKNTSTSGHKKNLLQKTPFARFVGYGIATTSYLWQLFFAITSILFIGMQGAIIDFQSNTTLGKMISWVVDLNELISVDKIGLLCWAIATVIVCATFIVFFFWFRIQNINPLKTTLSSFITFCALALSILPFMNIFPWILLWIIYTQTTSLFSRTSS